MTHLGTYPSASAYTFLASPTEPRMLEQNASKHANSCAGGLDWTSFAYPSDGNAVDPWSSKPGPRKVRSQLYLPRLLYHRVHTRNAQARQPHGSWRTRFTREDPYLPSTRTLRKNSVSSRSPGLSRHSRFCVTSRGLAYSALTALLFRMPSNNAACASSAPLSYSRPLALRTA